MRVWSIPKPSTLGSSGSPGVFQLSSRGCLLPYTRWRGLQGPAGLVTLVTQVTLVTHVTQVTLVTQSPDLFRETTLFLGFSHQTRVKPKRNMSPVPPRLVSVCCGKLVNPVNPSDLRNQVNPVILVNQVNLCNPSGLGNLGKLVNLVNLVNRAHQLSLACSSLEHILKALIKSCRP